MRAVLLAAATATGVAVAGCGTTSHAFRPETVGSAAHTWSDPADAGGRAGPVIAPLATVRVTCAEHGFKVADGNTWWYRIASAPWNDRYYVSADAFYNNGHTAGTLKQTPFVDPKVSSC